MSDPNRFATKTDTELEVFRECARLLRDSDVLAESAPIASLVVRINNELHLREVARKDAATTARDAEVDAIAAGAGGEAR